jgi:RNA polymerase sigma-70 factor (ECF subfamily)
MGALPLTRGSKVESLFQELRPDLMALFTRQHRDPALAEDLVQETFVAVLRNPAGLTEARSERAYIFGIARHISIDAFRRRRSTEPLDDNWSGETAESDDRIDDMRAAVRELKPLAREILDLRIKRELSYAEISRHLAVPMGTVRSRLHAAVSELRAKLISKSL